MPEYDALVVVTAYPQVEMVPLDIGGGSYTRHLGARFCIRQRGVFASAVTIGDVGPIIGVSLFTGIGSRFPV